MNSLRLLRALVLATLSCCVLLPLGGCPQEENVILLEVQSPEDLERMTIEVIPLDGSAELAMVTRDVNRSAESIAEDPIRVAVQLRSARDVMVILRSTLADGRKLFAQRCFVVVGTVQEDVWLSELDAMNDQDGDGYPRVPSAGCFRPSEGGTPRACPAGDALLCEAVGQYDCADDDRDRFPFAVEVCGNAVDEDCNGVAEECEDSDGDGFLPCGAPMDTSGTCDCAEGNADIHPDAADPCGDGVDTDCDGEDDLCDADCDGYPTGLSATSFNDCVDAPDGAMGTTGRVPGAEIHPNGSLATILRRADGDRRARGCPASVITMTSSDACSVMSVGDGVDQDCNGFVDDGAGCEDTLDRDRDGSPACTASMPTMCDRNDCDPGIRFGGNEICGNDIDEDGDGMAQPCAAGDNDRDGHVALSSGGDDCNDSDPEIFAGAPENCTTTVSESCTVNTPCGSMDSDEDGYRDEVDCEPMNPRVHPWAPEVECNGIDDDCDGIADELLLAPGDTMPRGCVARAGGRVLVSFTDPADYEYSAYCGGCGITTAPNEDCCGSVVTDVSLATRCGDCSTNCGPQGACDLVPPASGMSNQYVCGCQPNYASCDGSFGNGCEVDTRIDVNNCGGCGLACGQNQSCASSSCVCNANFGDCDGALGCETDLRITFEHCGGCGTACTSGAQFCAGTCTTFTTCTAAQYESRPPSNFADRQCMPLTVCTPTQYESVAPTATTNRVCTALRVCTASEYQSTAPTATTNRVCTALTMCSTTEYQSVAPTAISNRVCTPLTMCTSTEYQSVAPTAISNRVCTALTTCTPTEYQSVAPTAVSNRVCAPLTICTGSQYEMTPPTPTTNRVCAPITACTATQYETAAPTATSNRVCAPLTMCTALQYESVAPTPTSNRVCSLLTVCTGSEYQSTPPTATSNRICMPLTMCNAAQYQSTPPTAVSDRVCSALTVCTASQYESTAPTPTSNRVCSPLTICTGTQYESTAPTPTSNRVCSPLTVCTASQYESTPPTATSNRVCSPLTMCTGSQYESTPPTATSDRVCSPLTVCMAGQFVSTPPNATTNRVCAACPASTFSTTNNAGSCAPWDVCMIPSEFEMTPGSPTSNRVCSTCAANRANCDGVGMCEVDLRNDDDHCGMCNNACESPTPNCASSVCGT